MSRLIYLLRCTFCGHKFSSEKLDPLKCPKCGREFARTQELDEAQIDKLVQETVSQIRSKESKVTRLIIGAGSKEPSGAGVPAGILELYEAHKVKGYAKFAGLTDHRCDC